MAALETQARKHDMSVTQLKAMLIRSWRFTGRPKQQPPQGHWSFWFLLAGRGFGKTISGAQWSKKKALEQKCRFALVAPTLSDVRRTMVEGETGVLSVIPNLALMGQSREIAWNKSTLELTLANGSILTGFSSEKPDRLRGPQHHFAWCEEVSSLKDASKGDELETTWSNLKLGLRLGRYPQAVLTSTPKANKLTKHLLGLSPDVLVVTRGSSYENRSNLSQQWWDTVVAPLEGTRTGRQEIMAELLEDVEGALWNRAVIDMGRVEQVPPLQSIVIAVDPNATSGEAANSAGIIAVGKGQTDRHAYVIEDCTIPGGGPQVWAAEAVDAYHRHRADKIVAEKNNGGEMVALVIKAVDPSVPVKLVNASRGKRTRAEPVATLYERKDRFGEPDPMVHHVGVFPDLEDEMTTWTPESDSPDRMDALVWGVTELGIWTAPTTARTSVPKGRLPGVERRARI